jgi:putative membrane protein
MAANQGVYNAFLAAGLIWSLLIQDRVWQRRVATCFLLFVFVAGVVAALTVALRPGLFQIIPSTLALLAMTLERSRSSD